MIAAGAPLVNQPNGSTVAREQRSTVSSVKHFSRSSSCTSFRNHRGKDHCGPVLSSSRLAFVSVSWLWLRECCLLNRGLYEHSADPATR